MADAAVIFDVDGVLLELTAAEEDVFFFPFEQRYGLTGISRDWNSYKIRNDDNIIDEILERHSIPAMEKPAIIADYLTVLQQRLERGAIATAIVPGATQLLKNLQANFSVGVATANFLSAAKLRLQQANLWHFVCAHAHGAEGGGHKRQTVARAIETLKLPNDRIVYVGDNVNDVDAGVFNGVHFIGFSTSPGRVQELRYSGAIHTSNNHLETFRLISHLLSGKLKRT
jgi:phosphoglycolate phosphatase-like HAD superfamily hydrolase